MAFAIRLRDLSSLSQKDREQALRGIIQEATEPTNGQAYTIRARIQAYENRYEMTSSEMRARLAADTMRETAEVSDWLLWLRLRDRCGG